jgi:hypothetical protein
VENAEKYPYGDDFDAFVHNILLRSEGILYNENTKKYYHCNKGLKQPQELTSNEATSLNREIFFFKSPSPEPEASKRSQSVPRIQNNTENEPPKAPSTTRQPRNQQIQSKQKQNQRSKSEQRVFPVQFQNCTLIGDDFLLGFAKFTLKKETFRFGGRLQTGFCISGLTISAATERLRALEKPKIQRAIVWAHLILSMTRS